MKPFQGNEMRGSEGETGLSRPPNGAPQAAADPIPLARESHGARHAGESQASQSVTGWPVRIMLLQIRSCIRKVLAGRVDRKA